MRKSDILKTHYNGQYGLHFSQDKFLYFSTYNLRVQKVILAEVQVKEPNETIIHVNPCR